MKNKTFKNLPVRKRFGQNFLVNDRILDDIIDKAGITPEDYILEIGPGHGVLTERLLSKAKKVTAVEIDRDLFAALQEKFAGNEKLELVNDDIMKFDVEKLNLQEFKPENRKVIGNIPYYITTPIIMKFIDENSLKKQGISKTRQLFSELIIMLQKEVGIRLMAKPGTKDYGALSVIGQYASEIKPLVNVPKGNFFPKPKVDSMVISLKMKTEDEYHIENPEIFWRLVHGVFISRRKTLKNSLRMGNFSEEQISLLEKDFDLSIRGETMNLETFAKVSNLLNR